MSICPVSLCPVSLIEGIDAAGREDKAIGASREGEGEMLGEQRMRQDLGGRRLIVGVRDRTRAVLEGLDRGGI